MSDSAPAVHGRLRPGAFFHFVAALLLFAAIGLLPAAVRGAETGVYVGNANGNDAAAMARFKRDFDAHVAAMGGKRPRFFNVFTDFRDEPDTWAKSAGWAAWSGARSGDAYLAPGSGMVPLVGVPLASAKGGWGKVDDFYRAIVAGRYDAAFAGIVDAWAGQGYRQVDFRIAYEMNGNFMPWAPGNSRAPTARADFVAAFRHVADLIHAQGRRRNIVARVHWNPTAINDMAYDVVELYPGDDYVDVIAIDLYSTMYPLDLTDWSRGGVAPSREAWAADPANRRHYWRYPNASKRIPTPKLGNWGWSVAQTIALARLHRKPIGFDEVGAGPAEGALTVDDDAEFPRFLAEVVAEAERAGVHVRNVNIWDTRLGDGDWEFKNGRQPRAAAAWVAGFGGRR